MAAHKSIRRSRIEAELEAERIAIENRALEAENASKFAESEQLTAQAEQMRAEAVAIFDEFKFNPKI